MLNSATRNGDVEYSPTIMSGSPTGYYVVIIGGVTQTGKSVRGDELVARSQKDFVYGPKGRMGPRRSVKQDTILRPDNIFLAPEKYAELQQAGLVLGADYKRGVTTYVPLLAFPEMGWSAVPDGHNVLYVSRTHEGVMRIREALAEYNPITILYYTTKETLRKRLDASKMSELVKAVRLQEYKADFAQFRDATDEYLLLMHVKSPTIPDDLYRDESARQRVRTEIQRDADRTVELIGRFNRIFRPPMSYFDVHHALVESGIKSLFGTNLDNLNRMLSAGSPVRLNLDVQMDDYINHGNYLSDDMKGHIAKLTVLGMINANGRHTLLLRGFGEPIQHVNGHRPLDDIILDFIAGTEGQNPIKGKIEEDKPTVRESVQDQMQSERYKSNLGLVKVIGNTSLKDGMTYSLGNTHLADRTHPSLNVVFVYPKDKEATDAELRRAVVGMDSLEVRASEDLAIQ